MGRAGRRWQSEEKWAAPLSELSATSAIQLGPDNFSPFLIVSFNILTTTILKSHMIRKKVLTAKAKQIA
ncbi:MAG: hypothetical protein SGI98_04495, partial [Verrucomicrobiota bacterium]|nr:hypothetical protein [Verrucomicrobiota bacterium]